MIGLRHALSGGSTVRGEAVHRDTQSQLDVSVAFLIDTEISP